MRPATQVRLKGDGAFYAPERDIAYLYAPAMKEALVTLDDVNMSPEMAELLRKLGVDGGDLCDAVTAITASHKLILSRGVKIPDDALRRGGWYGVGPAARLVIHASIGAVMFGYFFRALRDTTFQGQLSPQEYDIAEYLAAGAVYRRRMFGEGHTASDVDRLAMELETEREIGAAQERARDELDLELQQVRQELAIAQAALKSRNIADPAPKGRFKWLTGLPTTLRNGWRRAVGAIKTWRMSRG